MDDKSIFGAKTHESNIGYLTHQQQRKIDHSPKSWMPMAIFMLSAFSALVLTASGQKEGTLSLDIKSRKWKHGLSNGLKTRSNEECPSTIFCSPQGKYWHLLSKPERLNSIKSKDSNRGNKKSSSDAKSTKAQGKTKVP